MRGAPQGNPKDMPPPREFADGWAIPKPDAVIELPDAVRDPGDGDHRVSAHSDSRAVQDRPVGAVRGGAAHRPGARAPHHRVHPRAGIQLAEGREARHSVRPREDRRRTTNTDTSELPSDFLVGYAPGQPPEQFEPGQAKLIRAGSDIILQVHYTTNGKPGTDRSRIGLVFAKEPPAKRVFTVSATNGKFKIPAGDPNHRVDAEFELGADVTLYGLHPHMHGRGKDFEYRVKFPDGETRTLLRVPNYRATWQLWYDLSEPIALPKGAISNAPRTSTTRPTTRSIPIRRRTWSGATRVGTR